MKPTRRGWLVLAVVALSLAMSWRYGPRSLNAVVTPLVVAFVAAVVATARAGRPVVRRHPVRDGQVGETRTVAVTIETDGAIAATVADTVGSGLETSGGDEYVLETTVADEEKVAYEVTLAERGERVVGPLSITVSDVLGLVERTFAYEETTSVLAYPRIHELDGSADPLRTLAVDGAGPDREEFDRLREYRRDDPLRNVHWKAAARRPDDELVVAEYADADDRGALAIAAECEPKASDALATAVASLATYFLERGRPVGVTVGDERVPPAAGGEQRRELLRTLAAIDTAELEDRTRDAADVLVTADERGVHVVVDGRSVPFGRLVAAADRPERETETKSGSADDERGRGTAVVT